ncbi:MAG: hypothetical protein ACN6O8_03260 [Achromobacter sp.]|uniref:hypothetical protein n=1 Tax=Achromobacter sp. TaxID=134375 RepID=UPI003D0368FF
MATGKEKGSVTVDDVAAEAGVSIKTVARRLSAFAGDKDRISACGPRDCASMMTRSPGGNPS